MKKTFIFTIALLALVVYGESFASSQKDKITSLCQQKLDVPPEICGCIGKASETQLMSDDERAMVIAILSGDEATAKRFRSSLPVDAMMRAGMFMATAPNNCAKKIKGIQ